MRENESYNVKEMLSNGVSEDELVKALREEIELAKKEIEEAKAKKKEEQERNDALDSLRMDLISAAIKYMDGLKLIDGSAYKEEDYNQLNKDIKKLEKGIFPQLLFFDTIAKKKEPKEKKYTNKEYDIDKIIDEFLESL